MRATTWCYLVAVLMLSSTAAYLCLPTASWLRVWLGGYALVLGIVLAGCTLCAAFPAQATAFWSAAWPRAYRSPLFGPVGEFTTRHYSYRRRVAAEANSGRVTRRPRFSLMAMFILVTVLCVALGAYSGRTPCLIVAQVEVARPSSPFLWALSHDSYRKQLAEVLHNEFVLSNALRDPEAGQLPLVRSLDDPIPWLQRRLSVHAPANSNSIEIRLRANRRYAQDAVQLLDRVADAYVAHYHRQEQIEHIQQITYMAVNLRELRFEIRDLTHRYNSFRERFGEDHVGTADLLAQVKHLRSDETQLVHKLQSARGVARPGPPLKCVESARIAW